MCSIQYVQSRAIIEGFIKMRWTNYVTRFYIAHLELLEVLREDLSVRGRISAEHINLKALLCVCVQVRVLRT